MRQTHPTASAIVRRFIRIRSPSISHGDSHTQDPSEVRRIVGQTTLQRVLLLDVVAARIEILELTADFVLSLTSRRASGRGHHAIVDAVRAVGRLEPRIATQIVGHALDTRGGAAGRQRRVYRAHRIRGVGSAAGDVARSVGVRSGGVGVGRGHGRACNHADCGACRGGARRGPASAAAAAGSVVVHGGGRMVGRVVRPVVGAAVVSRRAVVGGPAGGGAPGAPAAGGGAAVATLAAPGAPATGGGAAVGTAGAPRAPATGGGAATGVAGAPGAAPAGCMRIGRRRPTRERRDQKTYEAGDDPLHGVPLLGGGWEGPPFAGGLSPGGSFGSGGANGMRGAAAALDDVKTPGGTSRSSHQLESSIWWRICDRSARYTARSIRGSLSSVPIQICTNTASLAYATMSVVVPPTTWDCPM